MNSTPDVGQYLNVNDVQPREPSDGLVSTFNLDEDGTTVTAPVFDINNLEFDFDKLPPSLRKLVRKYKWKKRMEDLRNGKLKKAKK